MELIVGFLIIAGAFGLPVLAFWLVGQVLYAVSPDANKQVGIGSPEQLRENLYQADARYACMNQDITHGITHDYYPYNQLPAPSTFSTEEEYIADETYDFEEAFDYR